MMNDIKFHHKSSENAAPFTRLYSPDIQPLLQALLSALADIDFDYEIERDRLSNTSPDNDLKTKALEKLKARHRARREPYIQQLAVLQQCMTELRAQ
jgi:hypothetical protein